MAVARGKQRNIEGWSRRYWSGVREAGERKLPWLAAWLARGEAPQSDGHES